MRFSPGASGCFVAAVEQFVGALSLSQPVRLGGWIVGRGESGHSARAVDLGAESAWNGGQRIINLLSCRRCSLISKGVSSHYQSSPGGQVVIAGGGAASKQGGEGVAGGALARSIQSISGCKICFHCPRSENWTSKKRGARAAPHNNTTRHTAMTKPRCSQCGLTSTIDCMEESCPGVAGFHPSTWARPLIQMAKDLERYETLIIKLAEHMAAVPAFDEGGQIAKLICDEAQKIEKRRGGE